MIRLAAILFVVDALLGAAVWFTTPPSAPPPAAPPESTTEVVMNEAHAPSHGPRPEEATAVEQASPAERVAAEDLPLFEGGLTPLVKHFALVTAESCTQRVIAWTADEQLFAADLKLTKEKDGARVRVLRDVSRRSPFERCLDHDLQAQVITDVALTAPAMRVFFSLPELVHLEKKPGALPEPAEVHALMKKCGAPPMAVHYQVRVETDAVVVEQPTFVPEDVTATVRACLETGIARRVSFPPESRPGWTSARAEVKTHEGGVLTRSTMRFVK